MTTKDFNPFDWAILTFISIGLLLMLLHVLFGLHSVFKILADPASAAWVQAIGSIAAILASVKLVLLQHQLEIDRNRTAAESADLSVDRSVLWAMESTLDLLKETVVWAESSAPDPAQIWDLHTKLHMHIRSWEQRDIIELPSLDLVRSTMDARALLALMEPIVEQMKKFIEPRAGQGHGKKYLVKHVQEFKQLVLSARNRIVVHPLDAIQ